MLIVADDSDLRDTLARLLGRAGHRCLEAASDADAIGLMEAGSPDLVLTDLHMPGMEGISVVRHARRKMPPIPVVLLTAYAGAGTRLGSRGAGGVFRLAKPFANADMLDVVERALGSPTSLVAARGGGA